MSKEVRILVVDDDESLTGLLTQLLSEEGYNVTPARSAETALEYFRAESFHLVISDIKMTGMSGIELLHRMKQLDPDVHVIIMTSYATVETAVSALRAGAYDYLIKPFDDLDIVTAVVARAVDRIRLTGENRSLVETLKKNAEELEKLNAALRDLALRDGLTGLFNHRHFWEAMEREFLRCSRYGCAFSLVYMDVDDFKKYNDRHGHLAGDDLLKELAGITVSRLRKTDLLARYGGEEFAAILPTVSKASAVTCAENIRKIVSEHPFNGRETQPLGCISVSIGVASYPEDGADPTALVKAADGALYRAKAAGRNRVCEAG